MLDIWMLGIDFFTFFSTWLWFFAHQSARLARCGCYIPALAVSQLRTRFTELRLMGRIIMAINHGYTSGL